MDAQAAAAVDAQAAKDGGGADAFEASPRRFLMLALFTTIAFLWGGTWLAFAPLADLAEARFAVDAGAVNALASSYLWLYAPGSLLSLYVVDSCGVRVCLAVACTVNTAVVAVRWLALETLAAPHAQYAVNLAAQARAARCPRAAAMRWWRTCAGVGAGNANAPSR
jgi:hypothetical protein